MKTHTIRFREAATLTVAPPQDSGLVRTQAHKVRKGECFSGVTLRPYVEAFVEKCDIGLANGSEVLGVNYEKFQFLDSDFNE